MTGETDLLRSVPSGALLAQALRLLVAADRREEFVGDLVEQAQVELHGQAPAQIARWLWAETLHSAPALMLGRLRRLARRIATFSSTRAPLPALASGRFEQRSWSVPLAISISAHALALGAIALLTIGHMEELEAPWVKVAIQRALHAGAPATIAAIAPLTPPAAEKPRHRRAARPVPAMPAPAVEETAPIVAEAAIETPVEDPVVRSLVIVLPPRVAEKRCLHCPAPKLPPAYVRLGSSQQMVVKTCVGTRGDVTSVDVVHGLGALADARVVDTVRGWRFSPQAVGDHPVPFCYPTRFVFTMN